MPSQTPHFLIRYRGLLALFILLVTVAYLWPRPIEINDAYQNSTVRISASVQHAFAAGSCVELQWEVEGIKGIYTSEGWGGENPDVGVRTLAFCPTPDSYPSYQWRVVFPDDSQRSYLITHHIVYLQAPFLALLVLLIGVLLAPTWMSYLRAIGNMPAPEVKVMPRPLFMRPMRGNIAWVGLILVALLVRLVMINNGGAYFWPDEYRADRAILFGEQLWQGDIQGMAMSFFVFPEHTLFRIILQPVAWSLLVTPLLGQLWLSLLVIVQILVVTRIAKQWGASPLEAWWVGVLLLLSSTTLYYSRHLLPYDSALLMGLLGIWVGTRPHYRFWHSVAAGVLALAVFFTYNGHWPLTGLVIFFHLLPFDRSPYRRRRRLGPSILGLTLALGLWVFFWAAISTLAAMPFSVYLSSLSSFSTTVTQGIFSEGYSFPFQFLWDAERGLALLWLVAVGYGLWTLRHKRSNHRIGLALLAVVLLYLVLALFSSVLERFVVYGRLVKMLVPFLCILAGALLHRLWQWDKRAVYGALALLILNAWFTIGPVLRITFAVDFRKEMQAQYGVLDEAPSFVASEGAFEPSTRYVLYGTDYTYYTYNGLTPPPAGKILIRRENAQDFLPYYYEGLIPYQRQLIAENDIPLLLIDTEGEE